ncbi:baseplate J/gp47 family protein [Streptomyces sp. AV19]|uniref:baseplate J/gp47 family protein n=1 Tax=Streptomyces sp. AV19 TaxID=2793068 RepID=UPI0018FF02C5|nr:baseplate J/gp47 family protein [Streptomyces sp. AV19]MBH1934411.1 baseplate J/gp47 family protein [Streptomyces sp. AV19]MDG4536265.1 baseplate J/gp47 family protein [Streptomyces sp. AV19]
MTLPIPAYDGRDRADIVGDAVRAVNTALPAWTGRNPADPGRALIESCADMAEALRDRVNRAPDRHRLELLALLGPRPYPAAPARTDVLFQLAAPAPEPVRIPVGLEVSTSPPAGAGEPVLFSTVAEAIINPCVLVAAGRFTQRAAGGGALEGSLDTLAERTADTFAGPPFHLNLPSYEYVPPAGDLPSPDPEPVTYLLAVLSVAVPGTRIALDIAPGPPLVASDAGVWEAWQGTHWVECHAVGREGTQDGRVRITLDVPVTHAPARLLLDPPDPEGTTPIGQLRDVGLIRLRPPGQDVVALALAPALSVTVPVVQAQVILDEELGIAAGAPGERLRFAHPPMLRATDTLAVEATEDGRTFRWMYVPSLAGSGPDDRHFTLDARTGEAVFAPVVGVGRGALRHGAPLPTGATVRAPRYLTGGGARGNVPARTITVLRTPLPYVSAVTNPGPATGGTDAETPAECAERLPLGSPVPERAVTPADYEQLALAASAGMARIHHVRTDTDTALDPAHNYILAQPAAIQLRFVLDASADSLPKDTELTTRDGDKAFTTQAEAVQGRPRPAGAARLFPDPRVTGARDALAAGDYRRDGRVSGPYHGGGVVLALVRIPAGVELGQLTVRVRPDRDIEAGDRIALSAFLPRKGLPWWDPDVPAAYACGPAGADGTHLLRLGGSPRWRPATDRPAAHVDEAVARRGDGYVDEDGAWLALQIRDPKGQDSTTYAITFDDGMTEPVTALQYAVHPGASAETGEKEPGQVLALMTPRLCELPATVSVGGEEWTVEESFEKSGENDKHVVLNAATGHLHFGPAVPDGTGQKKQHGKIPARNSCVFVAGYRSTLGAKGNGIPVGTDWNPPPGSVSVHNTTMSARGADGFTDTSGGTFQAGVRLKVVPFVTTDDRGWFPFPMLTPTQDAYDTMQRSLRPLHPAGVPVWLETPHYLGIRSEARVVPEDYLTATERAALAAAAERALYHWFNPVDGGPDGKGWPLGRPVYAGEAYRVLERVQGIARVDSVVLHGSDMRTREPVGTALRIDCGGEQTVYSVEHRVTVAETP